MTPNEMTQSFIDVTKSLIDVIAEENKALETSRIARIVELQESKQTAADLYETKVREISQQPEILEQANAMLRQELDRTTTAFEAAASKNVNALRAAMELNRRLVQTIAQSVEGQRISAAGYTQNGGAYARPAGSHYSDAIPISLDKTL